MKVIGVRFKSSGRIYYFDPLEFEFREGDGVIVETARGQEYGEVAQVTMEVEETAIVSPLKPVVRPATEQDTSMREQNCAKEDDAFQICQQKIEQHKLDMHLVNAEYSFNGSKLVFYFTADERVDFRDLVKDLASQFRTRIELRQIGVRDEAKMLGGLGICGRVVCCKAFLDDFHPVSIKMAKEQSLSLSPTKISGLCGRLMCCLQYEQSCYEEMKRKMPHINRDILTPDGIGIVVDNNVITEKTKVRLTMPDGTIDVREFHYASLAKPGEPLPVQPKTEEQIAQQQESCAAGKTHPASPAAGTRAAGGSKARGGRRQPRRSATLTTSAEGAADAAKASPARTEQPPRRKAHRSNPSNRDRTSRARRDSRSSADRKDSSRGRRTTSRVSSRANSQVSSSSRVSQNSPAHRKANARITTTVADAATQTARVPKAEPRRSRNSFLADEAKNVRKRADFATKRGAMLILRPVMLTFSSAVL
ncbi:MAG: stage 0 sporulation family protein [Eubacteriales bacterium]